MPGPPPQGPHPFPEPGAELDSMLRRIEQRVREQLGGPGAAADAPVRLSGGDVLMLLACVRELLRDREALLEDLEALEYASGPRRRS